MKKIIFCLTILICSMVVINSNNKEVTVDQLPGITTDSINVNDVI